MRTTSLLENQSAGFTIYDVRSYWQATESLLLVAGVAYGTRVTGNQYPIHHGRYAGSLSNRLPNCRHAGWLSPTSFLNTWNAPLSGSSASKYSRLCLHRAIEE